MVGMPIVASGTSAGGLITRQGGLNSPGAVAASELGIPGIRNYFLAYAGVAFVVRLFGRRLPDVWGVRPTVLTEVGFFTATILSYTFVSNEWSLLIPASLAGTAHAFVFPATMTGGSLSFPLRYRGLATTLMLTMFDVGNLIGLPLVGSLIAFVPTTEWPAYDVTFGLTGLLLLSSGFVYAWFSRNTS